MLKRQILLVIVFLSAVFIPMASAERIVHRLDFGWKFIKGDAAGAQAPAYDDSSWRDVQIPHDWSIAGPYDANWASATAYLPAGIGWYRKKFQLEETRLGKRISIEFDGVYNNSEVWINGHF
jgi:beta-galactosidase/beta-glucuronidase